MFFSLLCKVGKSCLTLHISFNTPSCPVNLILKFLGMHFNSRRSDDHFNTKYAYVESTLSAARER